MIDDCLVLAGREVGPITDRLRRYCGLQWSGGGPEVWAFHYYDAQPDDCRGRFVPVDLLVTAALHPGVSRGDLQWYDRNRAALDHWLANTADMPLATADRITRSNLVELVSLAEGTNLGLLTKVLHRKRPNLVPIVERRLIDWYRPVTGQRSAVSAWPALVEHLAEDLALPQNTAALAKARDGLGAELAGVLPDVRIADIAVWMGGER